MADYWALQLDPAHLARIIRGAQRIASMSALRNPTWVAVMDLFAVGSTHANKICERAGIDPDCTFRRIPRG